MDLVTLGADILEAGLGGVLAAMLAATARRYSDRRFAMIAAGMAALAAAGAIGTSGQLLSVGAMSQRVAVSDLGPLQLGLDVVLVLVVSEVLLYLALVTSRAPPHAPAK